MQGRSGGTPFRQFRVKSLNHQPHDVPASTKPKGPQERALYFWHVICESQCGTWTLIAFKGDSVLKELSALNRLSAQGLGGLLGKDA